MRLHYHNTLPHATLELILPGRRFKVVNVDIIVNPHVDRMIGSYVASELGVASIDFKSL